MKRVLVVTLPERGHYHPLLGPAEELVRLGHDVTFACTADIGCELAAAGVSHVAIPPGAPPPPAGLRGEALAGVLRTPETLAGWIRALLVEAPEAGVAPLRALVRELRPDVVALDPMAYDAAIAAELEGVPWVGWSTSLNPVIPDAWDGVLIRTTRALDRERHALFARHGLAARFRVSDVLSPRGTAVFATEALVGASPDPTAHLVGPSLGGTRGGERFEARFAEGRPIVYVSFGSQAWYQPARFERLFAAARVLDVAVVAAMGDLAVSGVASRHVRGVRFADQLAALQQASAIVTHGGANSVMEACALGVPLVVAPICNDQPHCAAFVERAGCGRVLDLEACSDEALIAALAAALDPQGPVRAAMTRVHNSYSRHDGARGAAELALAAC